MDTRWRKLGIRGTAGLAIVAAPVAAACSSGPSYDDWAATDGAAGRINLDEVQTAFKGVKSVTAFENRVNQIYEGDGIVLIRAEQTDTALVLEGWEDLNGNHSIDDEQDEKLFTITEKEDKSYDMRGYHANSYYHSTWGAGNFLFTYLLVSSLTGPRYFYATDPGYARQTIAPDRKYYRSSYSYEQQVRRNSNFFSQQKGFAGSGYDSAARSVSGARQSYQSRARSTGSYKKSSTGVRSSWGTVGRSGYSSGRGGFSRGGFFGGAGGQTLLGPRRRSG